jgi:hypothetical protein
LAARDDEFILAIVNGLDEATVAWDEPEATDPDI